jgi:hypothetical protein
MSRFKCKYASRQFPIILVVWKDTTWWTAQVDTPSRKYARDRRLNDPLCGILTSLPSRSPSPLGLYSGCWMLACVFSGHADIATWWNALRKNIHHRPILEPIGCRLDLCNEYCGCLIGMALLSSPSRSRPTHRKGRCSHDIVIPYASTIASLLIVYVSMRFPGVADVVSVAGEFQPDSDILVTIRQEHFVKFSCMSSHGRTWYI